VIRQHIIDRVIARRGRLHLFDEIAAARTAMVVIDMQGTFCAPGAPAEVAASREIVPAINRLAGGLRRAGGCVIWCSHANMAIGSGSDWPGFFNHFVADSVRARTIASLSPGDPGQALWHELRAEPGDVRIIKNRYSALIPGSSPLERILRARGLDTLLVCGTKTDVCCESTARDAMMLDFKVVMVSDATAALSPEEHRDALETVIQQFGDVLTVDEILGRLTDKPG
jgi:ureidoacrylate peracid hydrolase